MSGTPPHENTAFCRTGWRTPYKKRPGGHLRDRPEHHTRKNYSAKNGAVMLGTPYALPELMFAPVIVISMSSTTAS